MLTKPDDFHHQAWLFLKAKKELVKLFCQNFQTRMHSICSQICQLSLL